MKFTRILMANLLRKKVRLLLTVGSFAVALFLFTFLAVVRSAFSIDAVVVKADRLIVVNRTSWFNTMPVSYKDKIAQIPGVKCRNRERCFRSQAIAGPQELPVVRVGFAPANSMPSRRGERGLLLLRRPESWYHSSCTCAPGDRTRRSRRLDPGERASKLSHGRFLCSG